MTKKLKEELIEFKEYLEVSFPITKDEIELIANVLKNDDLNLKSNDGLSLLHITIIFHNYNLFKLLIENGININMQSNRGKTALHYTAMHYGTRFDNLSMVKLLLTHGADLTIKDDEGITALDYAKRFGFTNIEKLLENTERTKIEDQEEKEFEQQLEEDKNKTLEKVFEEARDEFKKVLKQFR